MISDNETSFISNQVKKFYKRNGVQNCTSVPYHSHNNGQPERMVQYTKIELATLNEEDFNLKLARMLFYNIEHPTKRYQKLQQSYSWKES